MANGNWMGVSCPTCGGQYSYMGGYGGMPSLGYGMAPAFGYGMAPGYGFGVGPWYGYGMGPWYGYGPGPGLGVGPAVPTMAGTYPSPYTFTGFGVPSDDQIADLIYDSIDADPAIPADADINVDVTGGVVTLTGTVPSKRAKHAAGDDAWWVPGVWDINNNLKVQGRRARRQTAQGGGHPGRRSQQQGT